MPTAPRSVLSHWHTLFEDFQTSALGFYDAVEEAVKAREAPDIRFERVEWTEKGLLTPKRTYLRVKRGRLSFDICAAPYGRGYFFSWWLAETPSFAALGYLVALIAGLGVLTLLLLSIGAQGLNAACGILFLIALLWTVGLPLGLYLLGKMVEQGTIGNEAAVLSTPVLGSLYQLFFNPYSYYRLDTALMFQETVRRAVNEVVGELRSEQGLHALSERELEPAMQRFLKDHR